MAIMFPQFSSMTADDFREVRFIQRLASLSEELEAARALVEHQCLMAILLVTTVVYSFARIVDSIWIVFFILPVIAMGATSVQHALTLFRHHVRRESLPAVCEGIGRLRHAIGHAPDICFDRLVGADLLPRHGQALIEDAVYGEYRGHRLSLAMIDVWQHKDELPLNHGGGDVFRGVVAAIRWPEAPNALPSDDLSSLVGGTAPMGLAWFEGYLLLAIPSQQSPFALGGLFARQERLSADLLRAASVMQIPHRLIDHLNGKAVVA